MYETQLKGFPFSAFFYGKGKYFFVFAQTKTNIRLGGVAKVLLKFLVVSCEG
jgi:hypothetical protein